MTIQFHPHLPPPLPPNAPRPETAGPTAGPADGAPASPLGPLSRDPAGPDPEARLQALVDKIQARLDARVEEGDLSDDQVQHLGEILRTFQGAITALGEGAAEGTLGKREVASGVQEALAALQESVAGVLDLDDGRPGRDPVDGAQAALRRRLETLATEPYSSLDRSA